MLKTNLVFIVFFALVFTSIKCKEGKDEKLEQICFERNFSQQIEKISLSDFEKVKQFEGKYVEMEGVFRYAFEDVALYPSRKASPPDAMWIDLMVPDTIPNALVQKLDERRIVVIGKVNLKNKGHYNGYMGTLDSVYCIRIK